MLLAAADLPASRALAGAEAVDVPLAITAADGRTLHVLATASPIRDGGEVVGALSVWQDVTDRERAGAELGRQQRLLDGVLGAVPHHVSLWDRDERLVWANERFAAALGEDRQALVGRTWREFWQAVPRIAPLVAGALRSVAAGEPVRCELEVDGRAGPGWRAVTFLPIFGDAVLVITEDITGRKRADEALRESEERFRAVQENSRDRFTVLSPCYDDRGEIVDFTYIFQNVRAAETAGRRPEELVGRRMTEIFPSFPQTRFFAMYRSAVETGQITEFEEHYDADGLDDWFRDTVTPIPDGIAVATQVITERRRAEETLRYHSIVLGNVSDAIVGVDAQFNVTAWNRAAARMYGYEAEEVMGRAFVEVVNPRYIGMTREQVREQLVTVGSVDVEALSDTRDGRTIHVDSHTMTLKNDQGSIIGFVGVNRDITEQKQAEAALKENEERQAFLLELNDALAPLDDPGEVQATAARVLGERLGAARVAYFEIDDGDYVVEHDDAPSVPHIVGRHPIDAFGAHLLAEYRAGRTVIAVDVEADPSLSPSEKASFAAIRVRAQIAVPLVKAGSFVGGLAVHMPTPREWTPGEVALVEETAERTWAAVERARAEANLRAYARNLVRSNEDLERFAYVASHDLQEPLRSIVSFTQLLERRYRGQLDQNADEYLDFIVEGGNRMQGLILDLLAFSRVNTTRQRIGRTDAEDVLSEAERSLDAPLREAEAILTHDPLPVVMADPTQLAQVFANLVSNAIKFRKPDEPLRIHVGARRADGVWEFSVRDNGIGIDQEYFEKIFVIFQRLHTKETYPGTGIGLAIVKRIIDRHGGTIRVESTPGEGATFFFTLPGASPIDTPISPSDHS